MKLLPKKKYKELLSTIEELENKCNYYETASINIDQYACKLRQQKYFLEKENMRCMGNEKEYRHRLELVEEELKSQKQTNRRLINLLYNPKKK